MISISLFEGILSRNLIWIFFLFSLLIWFPYVSSLILFLGILLIVTAVSYISLQKLNFKNLFSENSTSQIVTFLLLISLSFGFIIAIGVNELIGLIANIWNKWCNK